jgi:hypothetical protein
MLTIPGRRVEAGPTSDGETHPYAQSYGLERALGPVLSGTFSRFKRRDRKASGWYMSLQSKGIQMIYRLVKRHEILAFRVGRD